MTTIPTHADDGSPTATSAAARNLTQQLSAVDELQKAGRLAEAEARLAAILDSAPGSRAAALRAARLAASRGDGARAEAVLTGALALQRDDPLLVVELAALHASGGRLTEAASLLRSHVGRVPASVMAWLLLSEVLDDLEDARGSLLAAFEALTRAQAEGAWTGPSTTPPHLHQTVGAAAAKLRAGRGDVFAHALEDLTARHGAAAMSRIAHAMRGYLGDQDVRPSHPRQKPLVLYIPGLPDEPFMDPYLHPWASRMKAAFSEIRAEALSQLTAGEANFEDFVRLKPGDRMDRFLGGAAPTWEALFFYRHGKRYDDTHARCPATSAVLESIDLFRIPGQAPEICFSVLRPGTHILPHHGVSNARSVLHLALLVPPDCALRLVDVEERTWTEGELLLFDDTYLHESWNRSGSVRVILLMDCWNPHLTLAERDAVLRLTPLIGAMDIVFSDKGWATADRRPQ
jgi:aspartate beta-hydroxylase